MAQYKIYYVYITLRYYRTATQVRPTLWNCSQEDFKQFKIHTIHSYEEKKCPHI
jgi:hypothetical protein